MDSTLSLFRVWPQSTEERFAGLLTFYDENAVRILSMLPPVVSEVLGREGLDVLLCFLYQYGGSRLSLRKRTPLMDSELAGYLQTTTCEAITRIFAQAEVLDVPSAYGVFQVFRRVAVQLALSEQVPSIQIAREVGVTQRYLRDELKRLHAYRVGAVL